MFTALVTVCHLIVAVGAEWTTEPCTTSEIDSYKGRPFRTISDCMVAVDLTNNDLRKPGTRYTITSETCKEKEQPHGH